MLNAYIDSMEEHINETVEDLNSLHQLLTTRAWSRVERKGAERLLQILVEGSIGLAKHFLKQQNKSLPNDAYSVFEKLTDLQLISADELLEWRKIIGLRNAIVHDYLNLDEKLIRAVITNKMYITLQSFSLDLCDKLKSNP
jgi:uncharacterized protein YutE (UPF0331/DUF86 family)